MGKVFFKDNSDEKMRICRFDVPLERVDPRFFHPLLLYILTEPHKRPSNPLQFKEVSENQGFLGKTALLRAAAARSANIKQAAVREFVTAAFANVGDGFRDAFSKFPSRPSEPLAPWPSTLSALLRDAVLVLFWTVNNLQVDDVDKLAMAHLPYKTKVADWVFSGE